MLRRKTTTKNIVLDNAEQRWRKRPSEIRGYQRAFYITSEDGDYIRVDYNMKDKRVRLYIEVDAEGGNSYYSVITSGKITAERSISSGRSFAFAEKFRERAHIFSTLPNREVIKLINRNYGIQRTKAAEKAKEKTEKEILIQETKERYFKPDFMPGEEEEARLAGRIFKRITIFDLLDFLIGALLCGIVFLYFKFSYVALGVTSAFFGIIIGFVDMFFRDRSPVFAKMILFIVIGAVSYIYGYFF